MRIRKKLQRKQQEETLQQDVYVAQIHFYEDEHDEVFGSYPLMQNTTTQFLRKPIYAVEGKRIEVYKLFILSFPEQEVLGSIDYFQALEALETFAIATDDKTMTIKALTRQELTLLIP